MKWDVSIVLRFFSFIFVEDSHQDIFRLVFVLDAVSRMSYQKEYTFPVTLSFLCILSWG